MELGFETHLDRERRKRFIQGEAKIRKNRAGILDCLWIALSNPSLWREEGERKERREKWEGKRGNGR